LWSKLAAIRDEVPLTDPVLIVAVSTSLPQYRVLYSQARELAKFMQRKMGFERFASLYASALPPAFLIRQDGSAGLVETHFSLHRGEKRDIVLFTGDSSPVDEQYEFADVVLSYAQKLGVRELFSVGARWTEQPIPALDVPKVLGFATDIQGVQNLESNGVQIIKEEPAPFFASLVVGRAELFGMRGYKLAVNHGEPIPHPKSVKEFLAVLTKMVGFQVDTKELDELAKRMPEILDTDTESPSRPQREGIYH
jgi:proteasome assembly chaperone (PAC2) family protein